MIENNTSLPIKHFVCVSLPVVLMILTACRTLRPVQPLPSVPDSFSESGGTQLPQKWWAEFKDPELNRIIDNALQNNFDIQSAWQRLAEAKALYEREVSALQPDVDGSAEAGDRRGGDLGNKDRSEYTIGISASYEVDLWGRLKSQTEAERYRINATYAELQTAALSITAEITRTWFQIIESREQIKILKMQIETNNKSLQLLTNRFRAGQVRQADVLRQKQLVESNRERIIVVESRIKTLEHLIAVLQGTPPQSQNKTALNQTLPFLPELPAAGIPAELVRRRPDIIQAHNLVFAANKDLAVAITDRYPRLTLRAALETVSGDPAELFRDWIRSVSASLIAPLADGGERDAEVSRHEAIEKRRVNEYSQAVLNAFQEVEDALVREKKQTERIASLEQQQSLARQTYDLLKAEYFNGAGNFLDMLEAAADEQEISRELLTARLSLLEFRIALYRALAGGLELEEKQ